jgi:hypothetical protein
MNNTKFYANIYLFNGRHCELSQEAEQWLDKFDIIEADNLEQVKTELINQLDNSDKINFLFKDIGVNISSPYRRSKGFNPYVCSAHSIDDLINKIKKIDKVDYLELVRS